MYLLSVYIFLSVAKIYLEIKSYRRVLVNILCIADWKRENQASLRLENNRIVEIPEPDPVGST